MIFRIFISSVQREFAAERKALAAFIRSDAILSRFFEVFIFEEVPAQDRSAAGVYLDEVDKCDIYLGLHGGEYGNVDKRGNDFKVVIERSRTTQQTTQQTARRREDGMNKPESWPVSWPKTNENKILSLIYFREMSKSMLASKLTVRTGSNSLKVALQNLLVNGYIERTLPDKPCSRNQKYRLTNAGRDFICTPTPPTYT